MFLFTQVLTKPVLWKVKGRLALFHLAKITSQVHHQNTSTFPGLSSSPTADLVLVGS